MPDFPQLAQKPLTRVQLLKSRYQARLPAVTSAPASFVFMPKSQHIGSFETGQQLLLNRYRFAGRMVEASGWSIWEIDKPDAAFETALHTFTWLDDLGAVGNKRARTQAQEWVLEWVQNYGTGTGIGWTPALTGHRLLQQLLHAEFLRDGMAAKDAARWLGSLGRQADYLAKQWKVEPATLARFVALTGLLLADISLEGRGKNRVKTLDRLAKLCKATFDHSGGLPSRNPEELMEVFATLSHVHKALLDSGHPADPKLAKTLKVVAPVLRGLRLGDGSLTRFYNGGRGNTERLDYALAEVGTKDRSAADNPMGFQRLAAGRLVVIADVAPPPVGEQARTLGFEMSSGRVPVIVNRNDLYNTLTLEGAPEFVPNQVTCERAQDPSGAWMVAQHNGYATKTHERRMFVASDGRLFSGEDMLRPVAGGKKAPAANSFALQFNIHSDIAVDADKNNRGATLTLPNGEVWAFRQEGGLFKLETTENAATKQIVVISRAVNYTGRIIWSFTRTGDANR